MGVTERDRVDGGSTRIGGGGDFDTRGRFTVAALLLEERRRRLAVDSGDEDADEVEARGMTYDASTSMTRLGCSTGAEAGAEPSKFSG